MPNTGITRIRDAVRWVARKSDAVIRTVPAIADYFARLTWPPVVVVVLVFFLADAKTIVRKLSHRLDSGSSFKFGPVEVGAIQTIPAVSETGMSTSARLGSEAASDKWSRAREDYYGDRARAAGLVHRLYRSRTADQSYDALIYLVPHKKSSLAAISSVEYYFGTFWKDHVFESTDRSRGFPIRVSAYGPFLALAKLHYNDGTTKMLHRYVDFEMGDVAPLVPKDAEE
jgi:hypothetical protein